MNRLGLDFVASRLGVGRHCWSTNGECRLVLEILTLFPHAPLLTSGYLTSLDLRRFRCGTNGPDRTRYCNEDWDLVSFWGFPLSG